MRGRLSLLGFVLAGCAPSLGPAPSPSPSVPGILAACGAGEDLDRDGLADACEAELAERFAPVVYHSSAEKSFPTDVPHLLARTALYFHDDTCPGADPLVVTAPDAEALLHRVAHSRCAGRTDVTSDGSRSLRKHRTFYLATVSEDARRGSKDSRDWKTYVHAYRNDRGGVTLQYWRLYAFNHAVMAHGGDWEGLHVVLGPDGRVAELGLLGHRAIDVVPPGALAWEGTHPIVYSEIGGHTTRATGDFIAAQGCVEREACTVNRSDRGSFVRQETWTGGSVSWPEGRTTAVAGLVNVGEKTAPLNGQVFLRYSGLWGSPGVFYATSGYWGPAYNETSLRADGFITAWCAGMTGMDLTRECRAAHVEP